MEFRELTESERPRWDELVRRSPDGTLFHTTVWHELVGREPELYGLFEGGRLVAGAGVVPGRRFGLRIGTNGALTPYGGVVIEEKSGKRETRISGRKRLMERMARGLKDRFTGLSLRLPPAIRDVQPFLWEGFGVEVRYTYVAEVGDVEGAWSRLASQRRRNVRKAREKGFTVIPTENVDALLEIVEASFDRKREDPTFLADLGRMNRHPAAKDRRTILLALDGSGRPLAAANVVWDESCGYYLAGGFDPSTGQSEASALVLWEAMRVTSEERGLDSFDFDGSMVPGVERFFRKFGGRLQPRFNVRWSPLHRLFG